MRLTAGLGCVIAGTLIAAAIAAGMFLAPRAGRYQVVVMREGVLLHVNTSTGEVLLCIVRKPPGKTGSEDKLEDYGGECSRVIAGE
jgi:hypothetical protein